MHWNRKTRCLHWDANLPDAERNELGMLTCGGEGDGHIKKGPQIYHECLDGIVMLLIEMRNI